MKGLFTIGATMVCAAAFLTACGDDRGAGAKEWKRPAYTPELPAPRRAEKTSPENLRWLSAWESVRAKQAELRGELARRQKLHAENHFDSFLELNPETLTGTQLSYLRHFLEKGYFRLEREVLLKLLEARQGRHAPAPAPGENMAARIQTAMIRDEVAVMDLETAIEAYGHPSDAEFEVPSSFTAEETTALAAQVGEMMARERGAIRELDAKIALLNPAAQ